MQRYAMTIVILIVLHCGATVVADEVDSVRDILVTYNNDGATNASAGLGAPYRNRKRYAISADARRHARAIAKEYGLIQVDHWPIKSLAVYCFVYRVAESSDRDAVVAQLNADRRVESAQPMHEFEVSAMADINYDDTYANLQHGLNVLGITQAHRYSTGHGVRVAIIDSEADVDHEDLKGRVVKSVGFTDAGKVPDAEHGTAVASVIGAIANNAKGIVGVAPASQLEIFVACWQDVGATRAICDSFTLAKAVDSLLDDPPHVLNLSLSGPFDPLLERLLTKAVRRGVIIVAAEPAAPAADNHFPASLRTVIGVTSSRPDPDLDLAGSNGGASDQAVYAPGDRILVALPGDTYDLRSGSSLAAAHVSGVVALLLAVAPEMTMQSVARLLHESQLGTGMSTPSVNACRVLHLADTSRSCSQLPDRLASQKENLTLNTSRESTRSGALTIGTQRLVSW